MRRFGQDRIDNPKNIDMIEMEAALLLERAGRRVKLVPGRRENIKITTPADRELAEFYLKKGTE